MKDNIVIFGSSGHAKVVIDIVENEGRYEIAGLLDGFRKVGEKTLGYPVLGGEENLPDLLERHNVKGGIVAIGDNAVRSRVAAHVRALCPAFRFVTAIHPAATVAKTVAVGEGTVVMAGSVVNPCCSIGRFCIVNTNSSLDHDSILEDFSSLAPRAVVGGNCSVGRCSAIGIGAVLIHGVQVGEHTIIGAGSVVLNNIASFCVAYGTPAVEVRKRKAGDTYL